MRIFILALILALFFSCKEEPRFSEEEVKAFEKEFNEAIKKDSVEQNNVKAVHQTDLFKEQLSGKVRKTTTFYFNDDENIKNRKYYQKEIKLYNRFGYMIELKRFDSDNKLFEKKNAEYDSLRLVKITINDTLFENYIYNETNGQIKEIHCYPGVKNIPNYNKQGLISNMEKSSERYVFNYYYDTVGRLIKEEWYENYTKLFSTDTYSYDEKGQLIHAELSLGDLTKYQHKKNWYNASVYDYTATKTDSQGNWLKRIKTIRANGIGRQYHERIIEYYE